MFAKIKETLGRLSSWFKDSSGNVRLSMVIMGSGQFRYGAKGKGFLFFAAEISILYYFITRGFGDLAGFFTLGTVKADAWLGVEGDNSVIMLLMGIFAWIVLAVFICLYRLNVRDAYQMQKRVEQGKRLLSFREEAAQLLDKKFYVTVLVVPVLGVRVIVFSPAITPATGLPFPSRAS